MSHPHCIVVNIVNSTMNSVQNNVCKFLVSFSHLLINCFFLVKCQGSFQELSALLYQQQMNQVWLYYYVFWTVVIVTSIIQKTQGTKFNYRVAMYVHTNTILETFKWFNIYFLVIHVTAIKHNNGFKYCISSLNQTQNLKLLSYLLKLDFQQTHQKRDYR